MVTCMKRKRQRKRRLAGWLDGFLQDRALLDVMGKFAKWEPDQAPVLFGAAG